MKKIILASSNSGKIKEIKAIFAALPFTLISQPEMGITDIEETGTTFIENAIIKARHATKESGLPVLADDSGLAVDALNGAPGVYSSRYSGPTDKERIAKLLSELAAVPEEKRTARYHCVLALMRHATDPDPIICHGIWEGKILLMPRGDKGFGYDPVFYVPTHHCSAGELDPAIKNKISHRAKAMFKLVTFLQEFN